MTISEMSKEIISGPEDRYIEIIHSEFVFCFWEVVRSTVCGMRDLSSLTRDQTYASCSGLVKL